MSAIWVEITATRGSAPRDAGTAMMVTAQETKGTIGGGALELQAIAKARKMLHDGEMQHSETMPLGPNLGQCCGGAVRLQYGRTPRPTDLDCIATTTTLSPRRCSSALWVWGAGHVGRAIVNAAKPQDFAITWIDSAMDRFPPSSDLTEFKRPTTRIPAADMPLLAARSDKQADHLIFTYSHDIDLALCVALLGRDVRSIGLIGSDTKWARFQKRLREMGLDPAPITCPIGDKSLGKRPDQIAAGVLALLADLQTSKATA